jgi:uncharacterized protein (TIGR02996 family)
LPFNHPPTPPPEPHSHDRQCLPGTAGRTPGRHRGGRCLILSNPSRRLDGYVWDSLFAGGGHGRAGFRDAILDDPGDDTHRLVFADWLEDQGQRDRAEWIRWIVRVNSLGGRERQDAADRMWESWNRCKPPWWGDITGVEQHEDFGLWWFSASSKAATARLDKIPWLGDALSGGWLGVFCPRAADFLKWKGVAREVPLFLGLIDPLPDDTLERLLSWPRLWGLNLVGGPMLDPVLARIGGCAGLRYLQVDVHIGEAPSPSLLKEIGSLSGLRQLSIYGMNQITGGSLTFITKLTSLRELTLTGCVSLGGACLPRLAGLRGLRSLALGQEQGFTDTGIAKLQKALPALKIHR